MGLAETVSLVVFCVMLEAFFSGSEIALVSISRHKLSHFVEEGRKAALLLEEQFSKPSRLYGTTSLGTNIFVVTGTALVTAYLTAFKPEDADFWASVIMGPVTLLFGEIIPKVFFQRYTDRLSYIVIYPLIVSQKIFSPVVWVVSGITHFLLGKKEEEAESIRNVTQDEIRFLFAMGRQRFDLHPDEVKMIHRVFEYRTVTVQQCMVPLINISAVEQKESINTVKERLNETKHSRLPVYADKIYNIVGTISAFDVLRHSRGAKTARDLMIPAMYVFRNKQIGDLLGEMQKSGIQMAVVVNEYSAAIGIITREDLMEEIFGEIEDEYDDVSFDIRRSGRNRWEVEGAAEIDFLNEQYGWGIPVGDYETIAGYILTSQERIPEEGEEFEIGNLEFKILKASSMGVQRVEITQIPEPEEEDDENNPTGS